MRLGPGARRANQQDLGAGTATVRVPFRGVHQPGGQLAPSCTTSRRTVAFTFSTGGGTATALAGRVRASRFPRGRSRARGRSSQAAGCPSVPPRSSAGTCERPVRRRHTFCRSQDCPRCAGRSRRQVGRRQASGEQGGVALRGLAWRTQSTAGPSASSTRCWDHGRGYGPWVMAADRLRARRNAPATAYRPRARIVARGARYG